MVVWQNTYYGIIEQLWDYFIGKYNISFVFSVWIENLY